MIKKVLLTCLILIFAVASRQSTSYAASTDGVSTQKYSYNCSDSSSVCVAVQLAYGDSAGYSPDMTIPYGANVLINGTTFPDSKFNMRFYLIDNSTGLVVPGTTINAGPFGDGRAISWRATKTGSYKVRALCFGNDPSYQCEGEGKADYTRQ
ncbi:hypothetical protein [Bacillus sp. UNCCL81]|uniref:hypothetical protein n=1 Tax=Bacillus sp. UNCCL81 TaxID=1502755 RepID=UPI0008E95AD0|nr:hypothetical protein [Bacillus sp. UNCCL81]SFD61855.1 hypothetical protein SAMN02799633_04307 [Bacillus sp. UNCCL81]